MTAIVVTFGVQSRNAPISMNPRPRPRSPSIASAFLSKPAARPAQHQQGSSAVCSLSAMIDLPLVDVDVVGTEQQHHSSGALQY